MGDSGSVNPVVEKVPEVEKDPEDEGALLKARMKEMETALAEVKKELTMKVKHYEAKLVTMTVINGALQTENENLKDALQASSKPSNAEVELQELHEEFTKRLGVAEKTASVMKEECFGLRKEVEEFKKMKESLNKQITEKNKAIEQYKGEGDLLARKLGESESSIKKLRADFAKVELEKEKLVARVQVLEAAAKSVEASRSASVEEANQTVATLRQAISEQKNHFTKLLQEAEDQLEEERAKMNEKITQQSNQFAKEMQQREQLFTASLDGLRQSLAQANQEVSEREDRLREEVTQLEARCRVAETAQEEAVGRLTEATRPLVRQMESMSAHISRLESASKEREERLQHQVQVLELSTQKAVEAQKRAEASCISAERRAKLAEKMASDARLEAQTAQQRFREDALERKSQKEQCLSAMEQVAVAEEGQKEAMLALASACQQKEGSEYADGLVQAAERALEVLKLEMKAEMEEERRRFEQEKAALEKRERELKRTSSSPRSGISSANASRQNSGREANGWLEEELGEGRGRGGFWDESSSSSWKGGGSSGSFREGEGSVASKAGGGGAVAMERLLAKVRQQAGEILQLQKELTSAKSTSEHASEELLKVSKKLHMLEQESSRSSQLAKEFEALKKRHDMALVIIGERNEKAEELEEDLADVKELYREQMKLITNEIDPEKWPKGYRICLFCSHCAQVQRSKKKSNS